MSRDALKAGLVKARGCETDAARAEVVPLSYALFYGTIASWLGAGVSLIAEYAFVRGRSEVEIRPLIRLARAVVVHCDTSDEEARRRFVGRERTNQRTRPDLLAGIVGRMERGGYDWARFEAPDLGAPTLRVDTTRGYSPGLAAIVAFCRESRTGEGGEEQPGDSEPSIRR